MERVLVTGGCGYTGSVLVRHLLEAGHAVTVLDNMSCGQPLLSAAGHPCFDFVPGDVRDERRLRDVLAKADVIIWLAGLVGARACDRDPELARAVNLESVKQLNRLRSREQRVIYPCTNSGYGSRTGEVHCTEETALEPISLYGRTKVDAEQEILSAENSISLRLATVFGPSPRMRLDLLVNSFVWKALTEGSLVIYEKDFRRNYVHVDDVAECYRHCMAHFVTMRGEAFNVGLDEANYSKAELAELIQTFIPRLYIHYAEVGSDPDKRDYIISNAKLQSRGFVARRTLQQGIPQVIKACLMIREKDSIYGN